MNGAPLPRIALVTCSALPEGSGDDEPLREALHQSFDPVTVAWDAPEVTWGDFAAVLIRSTWDYHHRLVDFTRWIDGLERAGVRLFNPAPLARWNARKSYLVDLQVEGIPVVPTTWIASGGIDVLPDVVHDEPGESFVLKPVVGATSHLTHHVTAQNATDVATALRGAEPPGGWMLQPFLRQVLDPGEWSLVFFEGEFSHAVIKRPREGDFRVQSDFGGTYRWAVPPPALVEQARAAVEASPEMPLYARVDGVDHDGTFILIELELIEPELFFRHEREAAGRMAAAIARRLSG